MRPRAETWSEIQGRIGRACSGPLTKAVLGLLSVNTFGSQCARVWRIPVAHQYAQTECLDVSAYLVSCRALLISIFRN